MLTMTAKDQLLKTFGQRIRQLRVSKGISQEDFAEMAELHRTYISDVERGERNVSIATAYRIAQALGVDLKDLF
jgi:transcriptional regulator with XRE-family HTH domain